MYDSEFYKIITVRVLFVKSGCSIISENCETLFIDPRVLKNLQMQGYGVELGVCFHTATTAGWRGLWMGFDVVASQW